MDISFLLEDIQFVDIMVYDIDNILTEMSYEDYTDHFYSRLKALAIEYNKNDKIFKHLSKILNIDIKELPKFDCQIQHTGEKQLCFSLINPDVDFEIKANYERYLRDMINELHTDIKEYSEVSNIWTADGNGLIYINLNCNQ